MVSVTDACFFRHREVVGLFLSWLCFVIKTNMHNFANLPDERWYFINSVSFEYGLLHSSGLLPANLAVLNYPIIAVGYVIFISIGS